MDDIVRARTWLRRWLGWDRCPTCQSAVRLPVYGGPHAKQATWVYDGTRMVGPYCSDACASPLSRRLKVYMLNEARMLTGQTR